MSGITKALGKALKDALASSNFSKIWTAGRQGSSAFSNTHIRVDRDGDRRVLQINAQTSDATLKKYIQLHGTHAKLAVIDISGQTGTQAEKQSFVDKAMQEVKG